MTSFASIDKFFLHLCDFFVSSRQVVRQRYTLLKALQGLGSVRQLRQITACWAKLTTGLNRPTASEGTKKLL
jgi:hypothetical protein